MKMSASLFFAVKHFSVPRKTLTPALSSHDEQGLFNAPILPASPKQTKRVSAVAGSI